MEKRSILLALRSYVCVALFLAAALAVAGGYSSARPGPQGLVLVKQPVVQWRITPTGGLKITDCEMSVNGEKVDATYSPEVGALLYRPAQPLPAGDYSVECSVQFDNKWKPQEKWTFTVSKDAVDSLPTPDDKQNEGLRAANAYRRGLGLPDLQMEASLCASAQAHVHFLQTNHVFGHYEKDGMPNFVGAKPIDRAESFGHAGGVWEDVAMMRNTPSGFVQQLFDAPYHRLPYMQPGAVPFGMGFDGRFSCIDFGFTTTEGFISSPAADQTGIPTSWDGIELPSPLAVHGATGPVGYPIVCAYFADNVETVILDSASLTGPAGDVPMWVNTSANDQELTNAIVLMSKSPLQPGVTYQVSVTAHTEAGKKLSKSWRFTTAP
jgi:uncharacterized protein YkwD